MKNAFTLTRLKVLLVVVISLVTSIWGGIVLHQRKQAREVYQQSLVVDSRAGLNLCRNPDCYWSHRFCTPENGVYVCRTYWNRNTASPRMRAVREMVCNNAPQTFCEIGEGTSCYDEFLGSDINAHWKRILILSPSRATRRDGAPTLSCSRGDLVATTTLPEVSNPAWRMHNRSTFDVEENTNAVSNQQ